MARPPLRIDVGRPESPDDLQASPSEQNKIHQLKLRIEAIRVQLAQTQCFMGVLSHETRHYSNELALNLDKFQRDLEQQPEELRRTEKLIRINSLVTDVLRIVTAQIDLENNTLIALESSKKETKDAPSAREVPAVEPFTPLTPHSPVPNAEELAFLHAILARHEEENVKGDEAATELNRKMYEMMQQMERLLTELVAATEVSKWATAEFSAESSISKFMQEIHLKMKDLLGNVQTQIKLYKKAQLFLGADISQVQVDDDTVKPAHLVHQVSECYRNSPVAHEKRLTIRETTSPDLLVGSDGLLITSLIVNLFSNAVKFNREAGSVSVELKQQDYDDKHVLLAIIVTDTGIGMDKNELERVRAGDEFVQASASTKAKYGGSGYGLAFCRKLTERMGGSLVIDSESGKGTRVTCTLRCRKIQPAVTVEPFVKDQADYPHRVLLIEDSVAAWRLMKTMFHSFNYACDCAINGAVGWEAYEKNLLSATQPYSHVFIDRHMPVMDGIETARAIREVETRLNVTHPVFMVGVSGDQDDHFASLLNSVVGKPIFRKNLAAVLLRRATVTDQVASGASATMPESNPTPPSNVQTSPEGSSASVPAVRRV